jgi:hypothetical protein
VKYYPLLLLATSVAFAQQTATYNYDLNGHRVETVGSNNTTTLIRNADGREVPIQKVDEKVISDDGTTRVIERIVRQYSTDGRPGPPEKTRIEERKSSDGSTTTSTTTWKGDISGNLVLSERSVIEARQSADGSVVNTAIERPTINGSMEMVERREQVTRTTPNSQTEKTSVYTKDTNGNFGETARSTVERQINNDTTLENAAIYQGGQLVKQVVSKTVKSANGEEVQEDIFLANAPGMVQAAGEQRPQLQQRVLIDRTYGANGSKEVIRVQTPSPNDPGQLSNPKKVEEKICTGKCGGPVK